MPFDSELQHETMHRDFTGTRWTETIRRQRQRKRANAWLAECRKADKRPLELTGEIYACWLAKRDGIDVTGCKATCELSLVRDDDGICRNRVRAVVFTKQGEARTVTSSYRSGGRWRRMESTEPETVTVATIEIPNWDFVTRVTEFVEF